MVPGTPIAPRFVAPADPSHTGMGAIPYAGGVTFRVWSIFADSVSVVGSFNKWNPTATPLAQDAPNGDYWSVDVDGAAVGDAYKFYLPYKADPGHVPYRIDPYASSVKLESDGTYNAVVAAKSTPYAGGDYKTPDWNEAVIYELHIPTFSTGQNGIAGDFNTAATRLQDLADLGVNAIEILPLGQFKDLPSTGYNPGYIFAVEDQFGGPDGFRNFVNAAHSHGIAVIVDVIYNHLSDTDLQNFDGWRIPGATCPYPDDGRPDNHYAVDNGIYFYQDYRAHTEYSHLRFDFGRSQVRQYVFDNAMRWLVDRYADGLRFDSTVNIRNIQVKAYNWRPETPVPDGMMLLRDINRTIQNSQGWKIAIAEDLQSDPAITAPLDPYHPENLGFSAQWNNSLCGSLRDAATAPSDSMRGMADVARDLAACNGSGNLNLVNYSENHDQNNPDNGGGGRIPSLIDPANSDNWNAKKQSTLAAAVILTSPAIPMLFQGQEFLDYNSFPVNGRPNPIDWTRKNQFGGIWNMYRDLIHLRRNWHDNTRGLQGHHIHVLPVHDNMLVYHRWSKGGSGDDVIVVCNFSCTPYASYAIGLPCGGMWRVRFNSDSSLYDGYFGGWNSFDTMADGPALNEMPTSGNIGINAYTCIILSQD